MIDVSLGRIVFLSLVSLSPKMCTGGRGGTLPQENIRCKSWKLKIFETTNANLKFLSFLKAVFLSNSHDLPRFTNNSHISYVYKRVLWLLLYVQLLLLSRYIWRTQTNEKWRVQYCTSIAPAPSETKWMCVLLCVFPLPPYSVLMLTLYSQFCSFYFELLILCVRHYTTSNTKST